MARMKQLEDTPQNFTEQSNLQVSANWVTIDEAMAAMREIRHQEGASAALSRRFSGVSPAFQGVFGLKREQTGGGMKVRSAEEKTPSAP